MSGAADEPKALVFDIGSFSVRAGYAAEDRPTVDVPATLGKKDGGTPTYFIDANPNEVAVENMEAVSPLQDGLIEDCDAFQAVIDHAYKALNAKPSLYPVLMSEAAWNTKEKREKLTELMFESYNIPAFYICKGAVLATFANGRNTGLVLDSGSKYTTAIPVVDGLVIPKSIVKSSLAGDFLTSECTELFRDMNVDIVPPYMIESKEAVPEGEPANWTKKADLPQVTDSWHHYLTNQVIEEFKSKVLQVSNNIVHENVAAKVPPVSYQFPNGYNRKFGTERLKIAEVLFDPSLAKGSCQGKMIGVVDVVTSSIAMCDEKIRPKMYGGIVVVGGNTLLQGFTQRLTKELARKVPSTTRMKLVTNSLDEEKRRLSSWIGGSTFASLGSFKEIWISKQDYEEGGKQCVEKKCL